MSHSGLSLRGGLARYTPVIITIAAIAALAVHACSYLPFFEDDAFISLRFRRDVLRVIVTLVSLPILLSLAHLGFRLAYYGEWVPNTALVKITPSMRHTVEGLQYLWTGFLSMSPLSEAALLFGLMLLFVKSRRPTVLFLAPPAVIWAGYVAFIGGDTFPAWRHGVPLIILGTLVLVQGARWLLDHARDSGSVGLVVVCSLCLIAWFTHIAGAGKTKPPCHGVRTAIPRPSPTSMRKTNSSSRHRRIGLSPSGIYLCHVAGGVSSRSHRQHSRLPHTRRIQIKRATSTPPPAD